MFASVIICTRNRAASLQRTIQHLIQSLQGSTLTSELIIVDNGSSDGTHKVAKECCTKTIAVVYVNEPQIGKAFAINRGLQIAHGEFIAFIDDDVVVGPGWLEALSDPVRAGRAEIVAGPVVLADSLVRPWMSPIHLGRLAQNVEHGVACALMGANFGFARMVLELVHGFDCNLGPGRLGFGEESAFVHAAQNSGARLEFASPLATAVHHFDESRLSYSSFVSDAIKKGRSNAYVSSHRGFVSRLWALPRLFRSVIGLLWVKVRYSKCYTNGEGIHPAHWYQWERVAYYQAIIISLTHQS